MHRQSDGYLGQALNAVLPCCVPGERHKSLARNPEKRKLQGWSLLVRRARVTPGWRRAPSVQPVSLELPSVPHRPDTRCQADCPAPPLPPDTPREGGSSMSCGAIWDPKRRRWHRAGTAPGMQSTKGSSAHSISRRPGTRSRHNTGPHMHAHPRLQVSSHMLLPKQKQNKNTFPKET